MNEDDLLEGKSAEYISGFVAGKHWEREVEPKPVLTNIIQGFQDVIHDCVEIVEDWHGKIVKAVQ